MKFLRVILLIGLVLSGSVYLRAASTVVVTATSGSTASLTTYSFAGLSIGTASADRYVIVGIESQAGGTTGVLNSSTIGGIAGATVVQMTNTSGGFSSIVALVIAAVPTGTTATITVTFNVSNARCGVQVYAATGMDGSAATNTYTSKANDPTVSMNISAGGSAIGASEALGTATWTGLTEDSDYAVLGGTLNVSSGSGNFATTQTGLTVLVDWSGASVTSGGAFAAWAPTATSGCPKTLMTLGVGCADH